MKHMPGEFIRVWKDGGTDLQCLEYVMGLESYLVKLTLEAFVKTFQPKTVVLFRAPILSKDPTSTVVNVLLGLVVTSLSGLPPRPEGR